MINVSEFLREKAISALGEYEKTRGNWTEFSPLDIGDGFYVVEKIEVGFLQIGSVDFKGKQFIVCQKVM